MSNYPAFCDGSFPHIASSLAQLRSAAACIPDPGPPPLAPAIIPLLPHIGATPVPHHAFQLLSSTHVLSRPSANKCRYLPAPTYAFMRQEIPNNHNITQSSTNPLGFQEHIAWRSGCSLPEHSPRKEMPPRSDNNYSDLRTNPVLDLSLKKHRSLCSEDVCPSESSSDCHLCSDLVNCLDHTSLDTRTAAVSVVNHSKHLSLSFSQASNHRGVADRINDFMVSGSTFLEQHSPACSGSDNTAWDRTEVTVCPKYSLPVTSGQCLETLARGYHRVRSSDSNNVGVVYVKEHFIKAGDATAWNKDRDREDIQQQTFVKSSSTEGVVYQEIVSSHQRVSHSEHACLSPSIQPQEQTLSVGDMTSGSNSGQSYTDAGAECDPTGQLAGNSCQMGKQKGTFKKDLMKRYCKSISSFCLCYLSDG